MSKRIRKKKLENIIDRVFYFDMNVLSYLANISSIQNNTELFKSVVCLQCVLFNLLDTSKYVIPFSNAHQLDILNGGEEYQLRFITLLDDISEGWEIHEKLENKECLVISLVEDAIQDFTDYKNHHNRMNYEIEKLQFSNNPLRELLEKQMRKMCTPAQMHKDQIDDMLNLPSCLSSNREEDKIEILKINKRLKFGLKDINGKRIKYPNFQSCKEKYPQKTTLELVDLSIKESDLPYENFEELQFILNFLPDTPALSNFQNKIIKLSILAEFLNVSTEKLKSKTAFQGFINDCIHIGYGLRAYCFVTEDDALYRKAIFIRDFLDLKTPVYKIDDFITYILKISYLSKTTSEKTFDFKFKNSNDEIIKTYKIDL